jgi:proteasome accessory factor A
MAVPKVCGLETEYGIVVVGAENNPVAASGLLINAYMAEIGRSTGFDVSDESPDRDARMIHERSVLDPDPELESLPVNTMLTNGSRYYVDHAHPEMSTPEVRTALEAVRWDRAGDEILRRSMRAAQSVLPAGAEIIVHKNNSDGKGNSYGCHENYLVDRAIPFGRIVAGVMSHFVTRQVMCGSGKVGSELPGVPVDAVAFQISQRADFFEEEVGLETTVRRPIVNTRDEPHCDAERYRRLHVIAGDANMSETATFLKVATTAMVLAAVEDGFGPAVPLIDSPVAAIRAISRDPSLRVTVKMLDGSRMSALDIQWTLLHVVRDWYGRHGGESVGDDVAERALSEWEVVLSGLESDPESVADRVDWVAKQRIINAYAARHDLAPTAARLRAIDLQYHDLREGRCLADRAGLRRLIPEQEILDAVSAPPETTRAYFRGRCLERYPDAVVAANWDSIVFDTGADPLRRVPMLEPLRGTASLVANVIEASPTAAELIRRLAE